MSIIMVALSHYCCRTTLQCQKTLPKQHSFQFLTEGDQRNVRLKKREYIKLENNYKKIIENVYVHGERANFVETEQSVYTTSLQ